MDTKILNFVRNNTISNFLRKVSTFRWFGARRRLERQQVAELKQQVAELKQQVAELGRSIEVIRNEVQQTENFRRQSEIRITEEMRSQIERLQSEVNKGVVLLEPPLIPFNIENSFRPLLPIAESRIGIDAADLNVADKKSQFYTYFSEMGGEHSQDIIKQQHEFYLQFFPRNSKLKFLDIGCGSGEFLKFLKDHGISSIGIDLEEKEVERARSAGLHAIQADAENYLKNNIEQYCGISMIQVIEHIPEEVVPKILAAAVERLAPGGLLLIETLNMRHPLALNSFYVDPTHARPVPSDYLGFLMEWAGLGEIKLLYSVPLWMPGIHNQDVSRIYMNYALVGKKY